VKSLVTGSGGFLGAALVERLLVHGERDLRLFVRPASRRGRIDELRRRYPDAKLEPFEGSLTSPADCDRAIAGVDVIYHLAGVFKGPAAEIVLHTVVGSQRLLDAIERRGAPYPKVVLTSSFSVYGVATLPRGALVDESTPLEPHPERRDHYSLAKRRQEKLFWDAQKKIGFPLAVVRPGVIYGPGGGAISSRVGLDLFGVFLHLGRANLLPLNYVDNCADAIVLCGQKAEANGQVYNLVDDDLPTCAAFLRAYKRAVKPLVSIRLPWLATLVMSALVEKYHDWSQGQLPAVFTPYKAAAMWGGNRFSNAKIKALGWRQSVPTAEAMTRTFDWLREREVPR
jgi:nucleoside-diphosphate-sugar epimerase